MAKPADDLHNYMDEYQESFQIMMAHGLKSRESRYKENGIKIVDKFRLKSFHEVRVLAIGSGNGDVDLHFINALVKKYTAIQYAVIEPANGPIDEFKRLIESNQDKWIGVKFTFHIQGIEEYLEEGGKSDEYDFIHACNSIYCFRDAENTLRYLYHMLSKDRILLIRAETDGGWWKYLNYRNKFRLSSKHISGVDAKNLIKRHFPDAPIDIIRNTIEVTVTKCMDENSRDGNRMLDFISEIVNFRNSRPPDEVDESLKYFRDECCYAVEDELLIDTVEEDIIILKK